MKRRNGYSLIELLVAISAGAAVMGIAVGLLGTLLRLDRQSRSGAQERSALNRLADQFRRDAHAADQLRPLGKPGGDPAAGWQFQLPSDRTVEYQPRAGRLVRTERAAGKIHSTESYRLPPETTVAIRLVEGSQPPIVSLRLVPNATGPTVPGRRSIRIEATLATDHRFLRAKGS